MTLYRLSPFAYFIESQLIPQLNQYAVAHRLTGRIVEPSPTIRSILQAIKLGNPFSFDSQDANRFGAEGQQLQRLIDEYILVPPEPAALAPFVDHLVVWPLQNPAVAYRDGSGSVVLVRISMTQRVYSPKFQQLSEIIEEPMTPLATELFLAADG